MLERRLDELGAGRDLEQVGLRQRDRIGAVRVQLDLQCARLDGGRAVVHEQARAGGVQPPANRGADTFRAAGDQHHLVLQCAFHPAVL